MSLLNTMPEFMVTTKVLESPEFSVSLTPSA